MIEWGLNTMIFLLAGLIIGHRCLGDVGVGKLLSGFRYDRNTRCGSSRIDTRSSSSSGGGGGGTCRGRSSGSGSSSGGVGSSYSSFFSIVVVK